jgi:hypothetical protein
MATSAIQAPVDGAVPQAAPAPPGAVDAPLPPAMAARASDLGVSKAGLDTIRTFVLAVLAGAFIALGAMFATVVTAGAGDVPFGLAAGSGRGVLPRALARRGRRGGAVHR